MTPILKGLIKFFVFLISLILLLLLSLTIYLSNPALMNATLPYLFDTDEVCYEHRWSTADSVGQEKTCEKKLKRRHPAPPISKGELVYIQTLSPAEFAERYQRPNQSLEQMYQQFQDEGYALLNQWHARHDVLANETLGTVLPGFEQPWLGFQLMFVPAFPNQCLGLFVNHHAWLDYYLVLEFAACDE
ncbi:hypothetical protein [Reinekea blandensis]|uniref:Uncharacterized protein n=1 Tax=Reinekea blandensis MED297 TaxID=314283 RepID=A4BAD7_9GAMM|nr:hypothetical protein [Reinekea blandensis]EAR10893.1 hypothetical protein MED297_10296 [Reinekea sp. MED297] [Reinekea blandensis MED297]